MPCTTEMKPLQGKALENLKAHLPAGWEIVQGHHLRKEFRFPDFKQALAFTNHIGKIAEQEGHHPDIYLAWGKVVVKTWTHKVNGLTESDFILAGKIDTLLIPGHST